MTPRRWHLLVGYERPSACGCVEDWLFDIHLWRGMQSVRLFGVFVRRYREPDLPHLMIRRKLLEEQIRFMLPEALRLLNESQEPHIWVEAALNAMKEDLESGESSSEFCSQCILTALGGLVVGRHKLDQQIERRIHDREKKTPDPKGDRLG